MIAVYHSILGNQSKFNFIAIGSKCVVARRGVRGQPVPALLRELVLQRLAKMLFINFDTEPIKVRMFQNIFLKILQYFYYEFL